MLLIKQTLSQNKMEFWGKATGQTQAICDTGLCHSKRDMWPHYSHFTYFPGFRTRLWHHTIKISTFNNTMHLSRRINGTSSECVTFSYTLLPATSFIWCIQFYVTTTLNDIGSNFVSILSHWAIM
jgi:hypothetical protein